MNKVTVHIAIHVFLWTYALIHLGYILRSVISDSKVRKYFYYCPTISVRVIVVLYPHQHWAFSVFFILAILVNVWWYLTMVLSYIILMGSDIVHLLICLLNICLSSFVLYHLNICPVFLLLIDFRECLYILFVRYMHCKRIFSLRTWLAFLLHLLLIWW